MRSLSTMGRGGGGGASSSGAQQQQEEIFASDGVEPLPPVTAPVTQHAGEATLEDHQVMSARDAFEVFAGKLYDAKKKKNARGHANVTTTVTTDWPETPLERLSRLRNELQELQAEVDDASAVDDESNNNPLQSAIDQLQQQLQHVHVPSYDDVSQQLDAAVHAKVTTAKTPEPAARVAQKRSSGGDDSNLAARVQRLEQVLGNTQQQSSSNMAMMDRLAAMEQQTQTMDAGKLDALSKRVKVLRQDLEAASKARTKLQQSSTSSNKADNQQVAALYAAWHSTQHVATHLPALVTRLQQLAALHAAASNSVSRWQQADTELARLQGVVEQLEQHVQQLEQNMPAQAQQLAANMAALDSKLASLKR